MATNNSINSVELDKANNLSDLASASTARTNLGLGTLATQSGTFSGTSSGTNTGDQTITLTSDVTGSGTGSFAATLATVNSNVGSFGSATQVMTQTVNGKGLTTAAANVTITPAIGSITGLGTGVATFLATPSSANLASAVTDETGSGALVFATSPALVTPALGTPASGVLTNCTGTASGLTAGNVTTNADLTGDVTSSGNATTLATVNTNTGSFGSSTSIPTFTVNGKGLITAASGNVVIAPAGTLSGATLASGVTASSLTSVGTIATGTWNGTVVTGQYGGTGVANTGKTITLANNLTTSGNFALTLTQTGTTNVTLPTTGTLITLTGTEVLTNKDLTSGTNTFPSLTAAAGALTGTTLASNVVTSSLTSLGTIASLVVNNESVTETLGAELIVDGGFAVATQYTAATSGVSTGSDTITLSSDPGWVAGDTVAYYNGGGTTMGGVTNASSYFIFSNASGVIKLKTTSGGSAVDITGTGNNAQFFIKTNWFAGSSSGTTGGVAGWTLNAGAAAKDINGTAVLVPSVALVPTVGQLYKIQLTISGYSAGALTMVFSGLTVVSNGFSANGTYTFYVTPNTSSSLLFTPSSSSRFTLDNISIKPVSSGVTSPTGTPVFFTKSLTDGFAVDAAYVLNYSVNKTSGSSGNSTGLLINKTNVASVGTNYLIDVQYNGASQFNVQDSGGTTVTSLTATAGVAVGGALTGATTGDFTGAVTIAALLQVTKTTEQLRLRYDASNYLSATVGSAGSTTFALTGTSPTFTFSQALNLTAKIATYNNVATAGWGAPAIYGTGRSTAQTAAVASVAAYTVGAADGSFEISMNLLVTTSTVHNFNCECAYTDEGNTARVVTLQFSTLAGAFVTAITNAQGAVPYEGVPLHIRCKASTSITLRTQAAGTYTTVTYNVEGIIKQTA